MDWQLLIVGVLVLLALIYLGRQTLRTWRGKGAGCGACKCSGTAKTANASGAETLIPVEQIRLRRR
ncbi:MAG TPA: hypothetical protein VH643_23805 [Gemmataceae bacterium]|jgi:hypothetical protein